MAGKQTATLDEREQVQHLLQFFDVLQGALKVKLEAVYSFPEFLQHTLRSVQRRRLTETLTQMNVETVQHAKTLTTMLCNLGGRCDIDTSSTLRQENMNPLETQFRQQQLGRSMLQECRRLLESEWSPSSKLKDWILERLDTLIVETKEHVAFLEQLLPAEEPRYRHGVLEPFRVTSL